MKFFAAIRSLMLMMRRTAFAAVAKPVINIMCGNDQYDSRDK